MKINRITFIILIVSVVGISFAATAHSGVSKNSAVTTQDDDVKEVKVNKTIHDFGTFSATDGPKTATFVITNNTEAPILITNARASCGCTAPNWTKTPIEPEQTGTVTAQFDPKAQSGPFDKTITIYTNSTPDRIIVHIKGVVE